MTLFNIGPLEFILFLVLMFIFLGPEGMVKTARAIGTWIRKVIKSPMWGEVLGYSREIRELPTKIVRETGLDEDLKEIQKAASEATSEAQATINEANSEVRQTLAETGNIDIKIDPVSKKPGVTTGSSGSSKINTTVAAAAESLNPSSSLGGVGVPSAACEKSPPESQAVESPKPETPKPPIVLD